MFDTFGKSGIQASDSGFIFDLHENRNDSGQGCSMDHIDERGEHPSSYVNMEHPIPELYETTPEV